MPTPTLRFWSIGSKLPGIQGEHHLHGRLWIRGMPGARKMMPVAFLGSLPSSTISNATDSSIIAMPPDPDMRG